MSTTYEVRRTTFKPTQPKPEKNDECTCCGQRFDCPANRQAPVCNACVGPERGGIRLTKIEAGALRCLLSVTLDTDDAAPAEHHAPLTRIMAKIDASQERGGIAVSDSL